MTTNVRRWSALKHLRTSPKQYRFALDNPSPDTPSLRIGRALHSMVLEPDTFAERYAIWTGTRRGKAWEAFEAENASKTILTDKELLRVTGMQMALMSHKLATERLLGAREREIAWDIGHHKCAGRVDVVGDRLTDLKTAIDVRPHRWPTISAQYGYHNQSAWYHHGLMTLGLLDMTRPDPSTVVVQSMPPHDVVVWDHPIDVLNAGMAENMRLLALLDQCEQSNQWPGVCTDKALTLTLPKWFGAEDDEPLMMGGEAVEL